MATGRIGVTPTLGVRWSLAPTGGTTALSGLDDNSVSLVYSVGYEQVYRNGVLLSRGNDYTATDGTTITLIDATITGDIIEVFAQELVPLTDAISKGQFNAKGALLSATAASTPGVLAVGANDTVLTADSTTSTGLKWAAPAAGGMTLLSTTTLSGASTTISAINGSYVNLVGFVYGVTNATANNAFRIDPNGSTNITSSMYTTDSNTVNQATASRMRLSGSDGPIRTNDTNGWAFTIFNYASTASRKPIQVSGAYVRDVFGTPEYLGFFNQGLINTTSAITSLVFSNQGGDLLTGTVLLYGVK